MEKHLKTTIIVSVIVALVVSLVVVYSAKNIMLSPYGRQQIPSGVIADNSKACNADGVCETQMATGQVLDFDSAEIDDLDVNGATHLKGDLIFEGAFTQDCATFDYVSGNGTGESVCQQNGYDYCLVSDASVDTINYYDSTDGSCSGDVQLKVSEHRLSTCPSYGGGGGGSNCLQQTQNLSEPAFGDYKTSSGTSNGRILCCR